MVAVTQYKGQKVGVFGLGKAGEAAVAALTAGGAEVFVWDDSLSEEIESTTYKTLSESWPWDKLKAIILSPGVPLTHPKPHMVVELARKYNIPIIGEMELLFRAQSEATYIGITGTNGKSTTTALIGHILEHAGINYQVGGNLGTPALALEELRKGGVYVIEMSSYQLDLLRTVRFNVAVLLNITPDHLDRHGGMDGYIAAKRRVFDRQTAGDVAVVEAVVSCQLSVVSEAKLVKISAEQELVGGVYVKDGILYDDLKSFDVSNISTLTGQHNWQNAAAAYAACRVVGVESEKIYEGMQSFTGLRHRMQLVATIGGVCFINDSKATNADATVKALVSYRDVYWIAGGKQKDGGISGLSEYFANISCAFLIGEAQDDFAETLKGKVPYIVCGTLEVAMQKAVEMVESGDVVLFSPACASFDQFKDFEQRGNMFCELVDKLAKDIL